VFQFFHLLPSLTALENILVPMEIAGCLMRRDAPRAARRSRTVRTRDHYPSQFWRRAAAHRDCSRARQRSTALIADEPTGNLDSSTGQQVIDCCWRHRSCGTTLVW
jgi:putative ABC transport system ATP-binding protein